MLTEKNLTLTPDLILLDDFASTSSNPLSRLYENPVKTIIANNDVSQVNQAFRAIDEATSSGYYVVCNFKYELGEFFQNIDNNKIPKNLFMAWVFKRCKKLSFEQTSDWLNYKRQEEGDIKSHSGVCDLFLKNDEDSFSKSLNEIKEKIKEGLTYQVNYTFRIKGKAYGSPLGLYLRLRERQPSSFGAFIRFKTSQILSFSPEYFLGNKNGFLTAKPMKGTLATKGFTSSDLKNDKKNQAENLMIVDLLRNDMSKISEIGTVKVPSLFEVQKVGEVFQMTSTINSTLKKGVNLSELLKATFPCGSVTGAPKKKTMEIINSLENEKRNSYCGSIGWFDPKKRQDGLGNFMMGVSIRTIELSNNHDLTFGVGSGITIGSNNLEEWKECLLKASFLIKLPSGVGLFETIRLENGNFLRLSQHINRLSKSAEYFGICIDCDEIQKELFYKFNQNKSLSFGKHKVKIVVDQNGLVVINFSKLKLIGDKKKLFWAKDLLGEELSVISSNNPLFQHKTTCRAIYDSAWKKAEILGGFDAIFTNEKGEVTEGGRSNLFLKSGNCLVTPKLSSGLLPGVMRQEIIENHKLKVKEKIIRVNDVYNADKIYLTNSLRGFFQVQLQKIANSSDV